MVLKQSPDDHKVRALLSSPNTLATVLHAILYREFGDPLYSWEPETVGLEVKDTWGIELPAASLDKVCALLAALTSDKFFLDWVSFTATCQVLCGSEYPINGDPLLVAEASWGVAEVLLNDSHPAPWSDEVRRYVGLLLEQDGFIRPTRELSFAKFDEYKYEGSSSAGDLNQEEVKDTDHLKVVDTFVKEQSLLLFKQLTALPWVTPQVMQEITASLQKLV